MALRRTALAALFLTKARALPPGEPLLEVADASVQLRLSSATGWRDVGLAAWRAASVTSPVEPVLPRRLPPRTASGGVTFRSDIGGPGLPARTPDQRKHEVVTQHLATLPQTAPWVWTDGAADAGVTNGGAGAFIELPDGETRELPAAAGGSRLEATDIHQLRAGHWSRFAQYLHRIGRRPSPSCAQCSGMSCPAGWCRAFGEEADTPDHVVCT